MIQRLLKPSFVLALLVATGAGGCLLALRVPAQNSVGDSLAALQTRIVQLENDLHKARAIRDIKRLQYSYAHYAELGLWLDLGDLFAANGVAHYAQGDFRGPESLRSFYLKELGRGQLGLAEGRIYPHIMIQPVVTVASDGKTAKGRWHVIAMLGSFGASASWAGVVYENRYVFEDGVWKISELSYNSQYSGRYAPPGLTVSKWDLPYHFMPQAAGDPTAKRGLSAPANGPVETATFEALQKRYVELARSAHQLRDETEVLNLQHSYGYYFDQKTWGAIANLFASDGTLELGQRGVYAGRERIRRALNVLEGELLGSDEVNEHLQLATVVHVSPDGRTAKARGVDLSVSGVKGKGAEWEEGIFENEYVKQNGTWKIRSVHYYPRVITDYESGWGKSAKPAAGPSTAFPPDRPPTEVYAIYPTMQYPRLHYANPVTDMPVQYPPGLVATPARQSSSGAAPVASPPRNQKELATRLAEVERQLDWSVAYDAAENLVNTYGYYLDDSRESLPGIFATALDRSSMLDVSMWSAGAVNQTVQPVINLASDGKSATIRARLLRVEARGLTGGTYEGRALNRDGAWKLESLTLNPTWSSSATQWTPKVEPRR